MIYSVNADAFGMLMHSPLACKREKQTFRSQPYKKFSFKKAKLAKIFFVCPLFQFEL